MEIEAKLALNPEARAALEQKLGRPTRVAEQRDVYLATAGLPVALRVRQDGDKACVTLKSGFAKRDGIRIREEFEPAIRPEELDMWLTVFERLGLPAGEVVAKKRHEYLWKGVHVVIDEIAGLGTYVEVEVVGDDAAEAKQRLEEVMSELDLDGLPRITQSYRDLLIASR